MWSECFERDYRLENRNSAVDYRHTYSGIGSDTQASNCTFGSTDNRAGLGNQSLPLYGSVPIGDSAVVSGIFTFGSTDNRAGLRNQSLPLYGSVPIADSAMYYRHTYSGIGSDTRACNNTFGSTDNRSGLGNQSLPLYGSVPIGNPAVDYRHTYSGIGSDTQASNCTFGSTDNRSGLGNQSLPLYGSVPIGNPAVDYRHTYSGIGSDTQASNCTFGSTNNRSGLGNQSLPWYGSVPIGNSAVDYRHTYRSVGSDTQASNCTFGSTDNRAGLGNQSLPLYGSVPIGDSAVLSGIFTFGSTDNRSGLGNQSLPLYGSVPIGDSAMDYRHTYRSVGSDTQASNCTFGSTDNRSGLGNQSLPLYGSVPIGDSAMNYRHTYRSVGSDAQASNCTFVSTNNRSGLGNQSLQIDDSAVVLVEGSEKVMPKSQQKMYEENDYLVEVDCVDGEADPISNKLSSTESTETQNYSEPEPLAIKSKHKRGCDNSNMFVETSDYKSKKLCCPFCDKLHSKLARHMEERHNSEPDVQKFLSFPKGSQKRREIQDALRKTGTFNWNMNAAVNKGQLITSRRPNRKYNKKGVDFTTCPYCIGNYAKSALQFHVNYNCRKKPVRNDKNSNGERIITPLATAVEARIHHKASAALQKICEDFRDDEITRQLRFDWLLVVYGNKLSAKYTRPKLRDMIRNRLRLVSRVLSALKVIEPEVTELATLYDPKYYCSLVEAIKNVAKFDSDRNEYGAPATASMAVTAIKQIAKMLKAQLVYIKNQEKRTNLDEFMLVLEDDIHVSISKTVTEQQSKMRREKQVTLPSSEDIKLLVGYIDSQMETCYNDLSKKFSFENWVNLSKFTMASIIVFNRRRVGDAESTFIGDFTRREVMNENNNDQLFQNLSKESKAIATQYSRMTIRGKKGRAVPALLKSGIEKAITLLLSHRQDAGIQSDNEYLFALPSLRDKVKFINACPMLKKFAFACGAKNPSTLTGTLLRKHFATACVTMGLNDNQVSDVANHMGHHELVHREYYRQNLMDRHVVGISQMLEFAQGNNNANPFAVSNQSTGDTGRKRKRFVSSDFKSKKKSH